MPENYLVRTIFLQNYFAPSAEMAEHRRNTQDVNELVSAMKRTEFASSTLEKELNAFAEHGLKIVSMIPHPIDSNAPYDLLLTVVLSKVSE